MSKLLSSSFIILIICLMAGPVFSQQTAGSFQDELNLKLLAIQTTDHDLIDIFFILKNNGHNYYLYNAYTAIAKDGKLLFERVLLAKITIRLKNGSGMSYDVIERTNLGRSRPVVLTPHDPRGKQHVEIIGVSTSMSDIVNCLETSEAKYKISDVVGIIVGIPVYEYNSPDIKAIHEYTESPLIDFKEIQEGSGIKYID